MKFADYFKEAIAYGESLGLRNGTEEAYADFAVELDERRLLKIKGEEPFYPIFLIIRYDSGIFTPGLTLGADITAEQQIKLIKLLISAYEKYLADKKEPVAADSAE